MSDLKTKNKILAKGLAILYVGIGFWICSTLFYDTLTDSATLGRMTITGSMYLFLFFFASTSTIFLAVLLRGYDELKVKAEKEKQLSGS